MPRGGFRKNAGRKKGVSNLLNRELRQKINSVALIEFLQNLAEGLIPGASISERKDASVALLRKVLPDCKQTEVRSEEDKGFRVILEDYRAGKDII